MAHDPCSLIPDTSIPTGLGVPHQHAVFHVLGRIRRRVPGHVRHVAAHRPVPTGAGCEQHSSLDAMVPRAALPQGAALGLAGATGFMAGGGLVASIGTIARRKHEHGGGHSKGSVTPIPEPSSAVLLVAGALMALFGRYVRRRQRLRKSLLF